MQNFAEAIAEGRGKAQADSLRKGRTLNKARKIVNNTEVLVSATDPTWVLMQADRVASARNFNEHQKISLYNLIEEQQKVLSFCSWDNPESMYLN